MKSITILIITLSFSITTIGQINIELVSSAGEKFNNSKYQLTWSMGESVISTFRTEELVLTQGFNQGTYDISTLINNFPNAKINIFPNPTNDNIDIRVKGIKHPSFQYIITDINGKMLIKNKLNNNIQLNIANYVAGVYFLSFQIDKHIVKTYKIIKY